MTKSPANLELNVGGAFVQGKKRLAVRDSFVRRTGPSLVSRRQHRAFRLYLLCLWCCYPQGTPRLSYHLENKDLAALLEIPGNLETRTSSISQMLGTLEAEYLIKRERNARQRTIIVLHEDTSRSEYTQPKGGGPNAYVELPGEFFANGWLNRLSAAATLVTLIALREQRYLKHLRTKDKWRDDSFDWFQPMSHLADHYNIGTTTLEKGVKELKNCGFLSSRLTGRHPRHGGLVAPRNLYTNHADIFGEAA